MKAAIIFILQNFHLIMLVLSILIAFAKNENFFNRLCWAVFIFPVGLGGLWGFIYYIFYAQTQYIGGQNGSFEFEAALASLSLGIMGMISPIASNGYKKATATFVSIYLIGTAIHHIHQIIILHNIQHFGGSILVIGCDIIIPFMLWAAVAFSKEKPSNQINWNNH